MSKVSSTAGWRTIFWGFHAIAIPLADIAQNGTSWNDICNKGRLHVQGFGKYYPPSGLRWCYQHYRPGHTGINDCPIKYNNIHIGIVTEHTEGCFSGLFNGGQNLGIQ